MKRKQLNNYFSKISQTKRSKTIQKSDSVKSLETSSKILSHDLFKIDSTRTEERELFDSKDIDKFCAKGSIESVIDKVCSPPTVVEPLKPT